MDTICFTGHRDRITSIDALDRIRESWFAALWLQGGAEGFDTQVMQYCKMHGIACQTFKPNYELYAPKVAPLIRNEWMVDRSKIVYACYDGRSRGGTLYTRNYARRKGVPVVVVPALRIPDTITIVQGV